MRSISLLALAASLVAAQNGNSTMPNAFSIPAGSSSYTVTAGGSVPLTWTNPQGSTVTIKLQANDNNITPSSGLVLAQSIQNSGSATVTIPSSSDIPPGAYTFEIIDDSSPDTINFAPPFSILSASGTQSFGVIGSATGSASASGSMSTSGSSSATTTSGSASTTSGASSSSASAAATTSAPSSTASMSATESAPTVNAAMKTQAPLAAVVLLGAAALL